MFRNEAWKEREGKKWFHFFKEFGVLPHWRAPTNFVFFPSAKSRKGNERKCLGFLYLQQINGISQGSVTSMTDCISECFPIDQQENAISLSIHPFIHPSIYPSISWSFHPLPFHPRHSKKIDWRWVVDEKLQPLFGNAKDARTRMDEWTQRC